MEMSALFGIMRLDCALCVLSLVHSIHSVGLSCAEYKTKINHVYYPVRHCQRSNKTIVGFANVRNVAKCEDLARKYKAMAFNYASENRGKKNLFEKPKASNQSNTKYSSKEIIDQPEEFFNCEALACPEFQNFSHILNDTRFDYYSLYTNPPPPINSTCIPTVGIFQYYNEFANYSTAAQTCLKNNGSLAHILSEARTNSLSHFINQQQNITRLKIAYVGLNETIHKKFRTSADEPIECFLYRAWAPGHPRLSRILGCVALTDEDSWQMFACTKRLPFLCEVHTSGPPSRVRIGRRKHFGNFTC